MKRLMTLLLATGMLLGGAASAKAIELTASGTYQFGWSWDDTSLSKHDSDDTFQAVQRVRPQFNFVASENLSGALQLEIGNRANGSDHGFWGGSKGWAMGADGTNVEVRYAYVDWIVPNLDTHVRMGLQSAEAPAYAFQSVMYVDMAGISLNQPINDNLSVSLAWFRPYNDETNPHDSLDVAMLSVPYKGDGFVVNPWGMMAFGGADALEGALGKNNSWGSELSGLANLLPANATSAQIAAISKSRSIGWWAGIGGELSMFDPFSIAADFVYGSYDAGSVGGFDLKRAGWMISALASYKLDWMTPGLILWYASGDDSNPNDGSERLPAIYGDSWATNFGGDGGWYDAASLSMNLFGSWGIGLRFDDISFVDNLSHNLRVTYYQGTNNAAMVRNGAVTSAVGTGHYDFYLTTSDCAWEINLENSYQIYKNLTASFELGYIKLDLDEDVWGSRSDFDDDMYKAAVYMTYKF